MSDPSSKKFSWVKALILVATAGLLVACLSIVIQVKGQSIIKGFVEAEPSSIISAPAPDLVAVAAVGLGSSFNTPAPPARLVIPAIGVDAAIQSVGLFWNGNGEMGIPTNFTDVAWYDGGPLPGMPGSAVIDGHLDGRNVREAVFFRLGDLAPGDTVNVIDKNGTTFQFQVVRLATYDYNASTSEIFSGDASKERLNLITCAGDWVPGKKLYDKRIVVFTELVTSS